MKSVIIATEDELSEVVAKRLVAEHPKTLAVSDYLFRKAGFGYLKSNLRKFGEIAKREPVLLITDLDKEACALALITRWRAAIRLPPGLLFRVAIREVESWLLADHDAIGRLFERRFTLPEWPDTLADPKQTLLKLAQKAPRAVRADLCASPNAIAQQGLGYNRRLVPFAATDWSPVRAAKRSDSLRRARLRLAELASGGNTAR